MRIDGYDQPIDLKVKLTIEKDRILSDWEGTSGIDKKGINVPLVYTKAYARYALKCAIAPDIPNNVASLALLRLPPLKIQSSMHCTLPRWHYAILSAI